MDAPSHEGDLKGILSEPTTEKRRASPKSSQMSLNQPFSSVESSEASHAIFDCTIQTQYSWGEFPKGPLKEEQKTVVQSEDSFSQLPLHGTRHHIQVDQSQSIASINSNPSITEEEVAPSLDTKPLYAGYKSDYVSPVSSMGTAVDTFPNHSKSLIVNDQSSEPIFTSNLGLKTDGFDFDCISDLDFYQRNLLLGSEAASAAPLEEDLNFFLLQTEWYNMNFGQQNIDISECYDPRLVAEAPGYFYDSADYSSVDQSLFIAWFNLPCPFLHQRKIYCCYLTFFFPFKNINFRGLGYSFSNQKGFWYWSTDKSGWCVMTNIKLINKLASF